jgi:hypothetical protein
MPWTSRYPARATRRAVVAAEAERISDRINTMAELLRGPRSEACAGYRRHRAESVAEWTP